ncbi:MAG: hypothetical protein U0694_14285 [Anaerolineae bacterium]
MQDIESPGMTNEITGSDENTLEPPRRKGRQENTRELGKEGLKGQVTMNEIAGSDENSLEPPRRKGRQENTRELDEEGLNRQVMSHPSMIILLNRKGAKAQR